MPAPFNIAAGQVAKHNVTLVASSVQGYNFDPDPVAVEVVSDGAAAVFVSIDGTEPTVNGANCYLVPAYPCARVIEHPGNGTPIKVISAGTPTISVARV